MPNSPPSFRPLYLQIKALLERSLEAGEWRPGEAIPSEIELARRFDVSQGTVRKAIDALAADNLVVRRQGKGTFVATHTEEKTSLFRFLRIRHNDGHDEYPASRLLDVRRAKASAEAARLLGLKPGEAVIVLRRVLEYSGDPVVLDEITLPAALFRGLTKAKVEAYQGSMYSFFETAVRRADAEGGGEASCRRGGRDERTAPEGRGGSAAARRRPRDADLRGQTGRMAARPVHDQGAPLPQRTGVIPRAPVGTQVTNAVPREKHSRYNFLLLCTTPRRGRARVLVIDRRPVAGEFSNRPPDGSRPMPCPQSSDP